MAKVTTINISQPVRTLTISNPKRDDISISSDLKSNIILVSKYSFQGETKKELSIEKGDILKLVDRPGNGWLLVKFIDKLVKPGLIPASYVDIAINDPVNPITSNWLYENNNESSITNFDDTNYMELQIKYSLKANSPITINNKSYPVSVSISNFLLYNERYWYRLDIAYSDQSKSFICRYYQNFYSLHLSWLENLNKLNPRRLPSESFKLPKLPEPIPTNSMKDELSTILLKRCNDLNIYINKLILNENYQCSKILIDWLDLNYENLPGFTVAIDGEIDLTNDEINEKVLPGSINVLKEHLDKEKKKKEEENEKQKAEKVERKDSASELPKRTKSRNIYNHYQQITSFEQYKKHSQLANPQSPSIPQSSDQRNNSVQTSPSIRQSPVSGLSVSQSPSLKHSSPAGKSPRIDQSAPIKINTAINTLNYSNSLSNKRSPHSSPIDNDSIYLKNSNSVNNKSFVKCKIINNNEEIIAIKINKAQINSIPEFKQLVKNKIYFNKLFIKLPNLRNFENIDCINFNIVDFLKFNDKILLKIC